MNVTKSTRFYTKESAPIRRLTIQDVSSLLFTAGRDGKARLQYSTFAITATLTDPIVEISLYDEWEEQTLLTIKCLISSALVSTDLIAKRINAWMRDTEVEKNGKVCGR